MFELPYIMHVVQKREDYDNEEWSWTLTATDSIGQTDYYKYSDYSMRYQFELSISYEIGSLKKVPKCTPYPTDTTVLITVND